MEGCSTPMRTSILSSCLVLLFGCAADAPPPAQSPPPPPPPVETAAPAADPAPATPAPATARQLTDDTSITTTSGASFMAPKGWWVTQGPESVILEDPDRTLKTTLLEMPEADPSKAVDAGWQHAQPGFALKRLHDPESPPPIRGWEA